MLEQNFTRNDKRTARRYNTAKYTAQNTARLARAEAKDQS